MRKKVIWLALGTGIFLLIPLVLTLLGSGVDGDGWHWMPGDFVFAFVLIFGTGLAYLLLAGKGGTIAYRLAMGLALLAGFLLIWINAAVGIIGEDSGTNLLYFGVLLIGIISAVQAKFNPQGMARTLFIVATLHMLVPVIAIFFLPEVIVSEPPGIIGVFALNTIFALFFVTSGLLFRRASQSGYTI
jgi:hypothetical protein